ncbi:MULTISPECIES: hypothetical protein [Bacillus]|uniref:hypothetical protein n=1 Tax=Bacillus TaxID=1386 RepID=UPI0002E60C7E|nr:MULTISPECIES: hypothetical protein [Bacillus]MBM6647762.1 hypothetical protein [Bacillus sp. RIT 809]OOQ93890.1 hypothetical protein BW898_16915 [Bacillus cereus]
MQNIIKAATYLTNSFFVFHPSFYVTGSIYLTLRLVSAYIIGNILYNEVVKSNEVAKMKMKKAYLANSIEIERGGEMV